MDDDQKKYLEIIGMMVEDSKMLYVTLELIEENTSDPIAKALAAACAESREARDEVKRMLDAMPKPKPTHKVVLPSGQVLFEGSSDACFNYMVEHPEHAVVAVQSIESAAT